MIKTLPEFASVLVSVTEGCHVGCAHCGFIGSIRDRETDPEELCRWVTDTCSYGVPNIIFTGGEPFERFEVLRSGVLAATSQGTMSSLFTSSYWATSEDVTLSYLEQLKGLKRLYLSTDIYHQRTVPYENVRNVIRVADQCGIEGITLCITYATDEDLGKVRSEYQEFEDRVRFYESRVIPTEFIGRILREQDPMTKISEADYGPKCWLETPIINPNGDVFACHIGKVGAHGSMEDLPYWLGNLRRQPFREIMEKARYKKEYQFLRTHGPEGIARLYQEYSDTLEPAVGRDEFSEACDMCFSVLVSQEGRQCLSEFTSRPQVQEEINIRLALRFGEAPVDFSQGPLVSLEVAQ
ncbi:MAG TPA: radical SAM protein [Acidobacteriota bacterium]|nr:radical SAM protein [Acidobacteriota bacterium]